ncbi:MAG: hypothetical protein HQL72_14890 [Magnetococcales bacterium]|nr:hypothetical protein [Magnetococcales bacterium]
MGATVLTDIQTAITAATTDAITVGGAVLVALATIKAVQIVGGIVKRF